MIQPERLEQIVGELRDIASSLHRYAHISDAASLRAIANEFEQNVKQMGCVVTRESLIDNAVRRAIERDLSVWGVPRGAADCHHCQRIIGESVRKMWSYAKAQVSQGA